MPQIKFRGRPVLLLVRRKAYRTFAPMAATECRTCITTRMATGTSTSATSRTIGTTTIVSCASATHLISLIVFLWEFFLVDLFSNRQAFYQPHQGKVEV